MFCRPSAGNKNPSQRRRAELPSQGDHDHCTPSHLVIVSRNGRSRERDVFCLKPPTPPDQLTNQPSHGPAHTFRSTEETNHSWHSFSLIFNRFPCPKGEKGARGKGKGRGRGDKGENLTGLSVACPCPCPCSERHQCSPTHKNQADQIQLSIRIRNFPPCCSVCNEKERKNTIGLSNSRSVLMGTCVDMR